MTDEHHGDASPEVSVRETARLRASEVRLQQRKQDRTRRWVVRGAVTFAIVGVIAVVAIVIVSFVRPPDRGPRNMLSDGIVIGTDQVAVRTDPLRAGDDPVRPADPEPGVIPIRMYIDYSSPEAKAFETANREQLREWLGTGVASLEIHPIALPTNGNGGSRYPARAANALACVAELAPDEFFAFSDRLLIQQPAEGSEGFDETRLVQLARASDVTGISRVEDCIREDRFGAWVQDSTARAINGPIEGSDVERITSSPVIILGDRRYVYADVSDATEFARAFQLVAGESFSDEATATPTPDPSETPAP